MSSVQCVRGVAVGLLTAVLALPVGATTLRVEKDGSGDFTVIQDAVDAAAVGDTILIGPGRYREHRPFTTDGVTEETYVAVSTDSLTIRGTDRGAVIIGPDLAEFTSQGPRGVSSSRELTTHLEVGDLTVARVGVGILAYNHLDAAQISILGCRIGVAHFFGELMTISSSRFEDCETGVLTGSGVSDPVIDRCEFLESSFLGVSLNRTTHAAVTDCRFTNDKGIQFADGSSGSIDACVISGPNTIVSVAIGSLVSMTDCTISPSGINVNVQSSSHLSGTGNVLRGGFVRTMYITGGSTTTFHGNHILRNGNAPIVETAAYGIEPVQIDLTGNYWGTSSRDSIDAWILDGEDLDNPPVSRNFSEILFEPFEPESVSTEKQTVGGIKGRYRSPE